MIFPYFPIKTSIVISIADVPAMLDDTGGVHQNPLRSPKPGDHSHCKAMPGTTMAPRCAQHWEARRYCWMLASQNAASIPESPKNMTVTSLASVRAWRIMSSRNYIYIYIADGLVETWGQGGGTKASRTLLMLYWRLRSCKSKLMNWWQWW